MSIMCRNMIQLLQRADDGDLDAMFDVIMNCYLDSDPDVQKNTVEKCMEYIRILAMCGNEAGLIWMADAFQKGDYDYPKDMTKAIRLYEKAAETGNTDFGYECIGELYFKGVDVPQNYQKAYEYFSKAEEKSTISLYYLGEMYRLGLYVKQNTAVSHDYYQSVVDMSSSTIEKDDMYYKWAVERLNGNAGELRAEDYL